MTARYAQHGADVNIMRELLHELRALPRYTATPPLFDAAATFVDAIAPLMICHDDVDAARSRSLPAFRLSAPLSDVTLLLPPYAQRCHTFADARARLRAADFPVRCLFVAFSYA